MKIAHTGDLDISSRMGKYQEHMIECLVNEVNQSDVDLLAITGDIVKTGIEREYRKASKILDKIHKEKAITPGNHDFYNGGNVVFSSYFYDLEKALDINEGKKRLRDSKKPLIIDDDYILVGISTARRDEKEGLIGGSQGRLTENIFRKYGDGRYKILVMHHHLLPIPIGGLEENIIKDVGDIIRTISDRKINLILTGHQHHPWASRYSSGIKGKRYTTILTCGSPTMETLRGFRYNSYNIIQIDEKARKLEKAYVKVLTGEYSEKNMIPMNEFVKIPPMAHKEFIRSKYAHYIEGSPYECGLNAD